MCFYIFSVLVFSVSLLELVVQGQRRQYQDRSVRIMMSAQYLPSYSLQKSVPFLSLLIKDSNNEATYLHMYVYLFLATSEVLRLDSLAKHQTDWKYQPFSYNHA